MKRTRSRATQVTNEKIEVKKTYEDKKTQIGESVGSYQRRHESTSHTTFWKLITEIIPKKRNSNSMGF